MKIAEEISKRANEDPTVLEGLIKYSKNYSKMKTNAALSLALHTFGLYHTVKKSSRRIPVQSMSIVRRKARYGGKNDATCGRPRNASYHKDHHYTNKDPSLNRHLFQSMKKSSKLPHCLSECVARNKHLGQN